MINSPRIALLTHSTNPRGGVLHCLALGDALHDDGYDVTVVAPDPNVNGFPRPSHCKTQTFTAKATNGNLATLVKQRAAEYTAFLATYSHEFDLLHAHDSLSGSVAVDAIAGGLNATFVRTVHHLDVFDDTELEGRQARSIIAADAVACVSQFTADDVMTRYQATASVVGNGVDRKRFNHTRSTRDFEWLKHLGNGWPRVLAIGGIEPRKNTVRLLQAFAALRQTFPLAKLDIAGGVSLLNHDKYRQQFDAILDDTPQLRAAINIIGRVNDTDMPALYRCADVLAFPSIHEGFGLAVLEALACGVPVVTSQVAPFTEYLDDQAVCWCDPESVPSITSALQRALDPEVAHRRRQRGYEIAALHNWAKVAARQTAVYSHALTGVARCPK